MTDNYLPPVIVQFSPQNSADLYAVTKFTVHLASESEYVLWNTH